MKQVFESLDRLVERVAGHAHWLLRVGLAASFLSHSLPRYGALDAFAERMDLPYGAAVMATMVETLAAMAILVGGFVPGMLGHWITRLGAFAYVPIMAVAILTQHWGRWSFTPAPDYPLGGAEFPTIMLLTATYLGIKGNRA
ncbi:hypothetical protein Pan216_29020 [Planctomycetes bacterium Pan216]|uniref:DoxX n=1 Tax=Kolteria novifilia TaxID=2527975 RepID=A0A518B518_9BACT|nr:hypothetical protein Pan216_29020 [Planctomycetes bacterium Pan216]